MKFIERDFESYNVWINDEDSTRSRRRARVHFFFFYSRSILRVQNEFLAIQIIELDSNQQSEMQSSSSLREREYITNLMERYRRIVLICGIAIKLNTITQTDKIGVLRREILFFTISSRCTARFIQETRGNLSYEWYYPMSTTRYMTACFSGATSRDSDNIGICYYCYVPSEKKKKKNDLIAYRIDCENWSHRW